NLWTPTRSSTGELARCTAQNGGDANFEKDASGPRTSREGPRQAERTRKSVSIVGETRRSDRDAQQFSIRVAAGLFLAHASIKELRALLVRQVPGFPTRKSSWCPALTLLARPDHAAGREVANPRAAPPIVVAGRSRIRTAAAVLAVILRRAAAIV